MKPPVLLLFLLLGSPGIRAQAARSIHEIGWALLHPVAALRVNKISKQVTPLYNDAGLKQQLDAYSSGGRLDAFRHVFYMAAFAQQVKPRKLRRLGKAHEKTNYRQFKRSRTEEGEVPDSLGSVMDLSNNELGFTLGSRNKNLSLPELKQLVITHILAGEAQIMKRNKNGDYVDCSGQPLKPEALHRWHTSKCLVPSSAAYSD